MDQHTHSDNPELLPLPVPEEDRPRPEDEAPPTPPPGVFAGMKDEEHGYYWQCCARCSTWWRDCDEDEDIPRCPACRPQMLCQYVRQPAWAFAQGTWTLDQRITQRGQDAQLVSTWSARQEGRRIDPQTFGDWLRRARKGHVLSAAVARG